MAETPRSGEQEERSARIKRKARARARARDVSAVEAACLPRPLLALRPATTSAESGARLKTGILLPFVRERRFLRLFIFVCPERPPAMLGSLSPSSARPGSLFSPGCSIIPPRYDSLRRHPRPFGAALRPRRAARQRARARARVLNSRLSRQLRASAAWRLFVESF